jgi:hypothetical protein
MAVVLWCEDLAFTEYELLGRSSLEGRGMSYGLEMYF